MGSPRYMSPEMMESASKADARSDIWGLGTVLYELLVGDAPYNGETFIEIYRNAVDGPPMAPSAFREDVPAALDEVIFKCLRANPDERHADVADLAAALAPFGHDDAVERAAAIRRVLETARTKPADGTGGVEDLALVVGNESSRVRRRVSREDSAPSKVKRIAFFALAAVSLVAIGAIGARTRVPRPEPAPAALPADLGPAIEPAPPAPSHDVPQATPAESEATPVAPARTNADRRHRAPRHFTPPPPTSLPTQQTSEPTSPTTSPVTEPAPSPAPSENGNGNGNGKLFEDRK
jgi:serine/threonine-protein kinase